MRRTTVRAVSPLLYMLILLAAAPSAAQTDLDALFAPPTQGEFDALAADWATRDVTPTQYAIEREATSAGFDLQEVRHEIDGLTHYGVLRYPRDYEPGVRFPVLVLLHGGFDGLDLNWVLTFDEDYPTRCVADSFLVVAPVYRGEMLNGYGILPTRWSDGEPSPFDRDCDDTMALLTAVLDNVPAADPSRVVALGGSRGGNVAYHLALRDPRVLRTAVRYGPADFRLPHVQTGAEQWVDTGATEDRLGELVAERIAGPYVNGQISLAQARHALLAWSVAPHLKAGLWLQVHHGERDDVVPIAQSDALDATMRAKGAGEPSYLYYTYPTGGHVASSLTGHEARVEDFLCTLPTTTDVSSVPSPLRLGAAPNPFGGTVSLTAATDGAKALSAAPTLQILDARGRRLRTLALDRSASNRAVADWDGRDAAGREAPAGVYFAVMSGEADVAPLRVTRLK